MPLRRSSAHRRMAMAGIRIRKSRRCQMKKPDKSACPAIEEAGDQKRHAGRERQEDDEEDGRHRRREIGRRIHGEIR